MLKRGAVFFIAMLLVEGCATVTRQVATRQDLFWGEVTITQEGIDTYAHFYEHSETKRRVILVGMNHVGDKAYFESVAKILSEAEVVLYEGPPPDQQGSAGAIERDVEEDLRILKHDTADAAFYTALRTYFFMVTTHLRRMGIIHEASAFDYYQSGWESGDADFFVRLKEKETLQQFLAERRNNLRRIPTARKEEIVAFVRSELQKSEERSFNKQDIARGFMFFWSDTLLVNIILEELGKPRDEMVMGRFDNIMQEKNPRVVGIKFGAAHIPYQRKLLEERGYVRQRSVALRNMTF